MQVFELHYIGDSFERALTENSFSFRNQSFRLYEVPPYTTKRTLY